MRALFLSTLPVEGPSARPRLHAYAAHLRRAGIEPTYSALLGSREMRRFYELGRVAKMRRVAVAASGALSRLGKLLRAHKHDVVVVHRDLLPRGNPLALRLLERSRVPWIYDFDDAIYLSPRDYVQEGQASRARMAKLKDPTEIRTLIGAAHLVLAGNPTIAAQARTWNPNVRVQPTPVDTDVFHPAERPTPFGDRLSVGWIGSPTAAYCILGLRDPLARVGANVPYRLRVVGAGEPVVVPGVETLDEDWSLETEAEAYRSLGVGLYPLPDNEWTRGKCGYKALVYMASGAVPVVSPVGVSEALVPHGVRGFHARSDDEWVDAVGRLLTDPELRASMSVRGREFVEREYSVRALAPALVQALRDAADVRAGPGTAAPQAERPGTDSPRDEGAT